MSQLILARVHELDEQLNVVMGFSDGVLVQAELPKGDTVEEILPVLEAFTEELKARVAKPQEGALQ